MMATSQPTNQCDTEVYESGDTIAWMTGPSTVIEALVVRVRELTGARIDWHYAGGRACVLMLGDAKAKVKAREELERGVPTFIDR